MIFARPAITALMLGLTLSLGACGGGDPATRSSLPARDPLDPQADPDEKKIWELFTSSADPNVTLRVNRYLWNASLEVLSFLPVESVDPFSGVISTGYGAPPGGGRSYRATVYVQDPALDARSLKVALQTSGGGAASPETVRAVEDAILTRARQLRIADGRL